jgi:hypothetical protein
MKSEIRDGFYIIVDYTGRGNDVLYYEDSTGLVETDIGGLTQTFSLKEVSLSQGEFLESHTTGSMGTGSFQLYKNDSTYDVAYSIEDIFIVDMNMDYRYYDETPESLRNSLHIPPGYATSWVFANGRLEVEYNDYNCDSHTDLKFYGIKQTLITGDDDLSTVVAEEAYIRAYLYDPNLDDFVFAQELSSPLPMY